MSLDELDVTLPPGLFEPRLQRTIELEDYEKTLARHRRREQNLQLRQPTLPFTSEETVA